MLTSCQVAHAQHASVCHAFTWFVEHPQSPFYFVLSLLNFCSKALCKVFPLYKIPGLCVPFKLALSQINQQQTIFPRRLHLNFVEFLMFSLWIVTHFAVSMWQPHTHGKPNGWMCNIPMNKEKTWLALNWMHKMTNWCILDHMMC